MTIINLYKSIRPDGGATVSPVKPEGEYTEMFRLVAEEGGQITNGEIVTECIDVASVEGWHDVEADVTPEEILEALEGIL